MSEQQEQLDRDRDRENSESEADTLPAAPGNGETPLGDTDQHSDSNA